MGWRKWNPRMIKTYMLKLVYCLLPGLSAIEAASAAEAVKRFAEIVADPPYSLPSRIEACSNEFTKILTNHLRQDDNSVPAIITDIVVDLTQTYGQRSRLTVFCPQDHPFAIRCREQSPHAVWGASLIGPEAFIYSPTPNRCLVWHEMFHQLGAIDCYETTPRTKDCCHPKCVMRWEPCAETVDDPPYLCAENVSLVQRYIANNFSVD